MSNHRTTPLASVRRAAAPTLAQRLAVPSWSSWKALVSHIVIPLFLATGMALAYLGAFHAPSPHNLPVAVVGQGPEAKVFAQMLNDKAPDKLDVKTVADHATAERQVRDRDISAAYENDGTHATLIVATAASATTAEVTQKLFLPIAYQQNLPLQIDDVVPVGSGDATGQGLFFLMVALTIGGYASAIAVAAATVAMKVLWRFAVAAIVSGVIAGIGLIVAGPIFNVVTAQQWPIGLMAWLYVFGIISIGVGLHPVLGKWTTPTLTFLFVMLNITSCGGIFAQPMQPALFSGLNSFWNGAAWIDAVQSLLYFPGRQFGFDGLRLALWAAAGITLVVITHTWSVRKRRLADEAIPFTEEDAVIAA
ncbi:hypothetical protein WDJ51_13890 [Rathayibacter sp. YIM 133350]|uniref:hypothetical protein n=1 Tax=Rathayibacter sp. YIM 133350 TaxID=3131992 RepID=UPI00307F5209